MADWLIGIGGSGIIAGAAYWKGSLTRSGAWAAIAVGSVLYIWGSVVWFALMIGFFVTSTVLTKWKRHRKRDAESAYQKTGARDAGQVLANGGFGTLLCILHAVWPEAAWPLAAYIGVMATVTADTWATEIGGLSKRLPRSIVTWKQVPKGTSGGVSPAGWTAAACGGLFIGTLALLLAPWDTSSELELTDAGFWLLPLITMAAGWLGANADSYLGATLQAVYRCKVCGREVESVTHCGRPTARLRGSRFFDNDAVNMLSSVIGGGLSLWFWSLLV